MRMELIMACLEMRLRLRMTALLASCCKAHCGLAVQQPTIYIVGLHGRSLGSTFVAEIQPYC